MNRSEEGFERERCLLAEFSEFHKRKGVAQASETRKVGHINDVVADQTEQRRCGDRLFTCRNWKTVAMESSIPTWEMYRICGKEFVAQEDSCTDFNLLLAPPCPGILPSNKPATHAVAHLYFELESLADAFFHSTNEGL